MQIRVLLAAAAAASLAFPQGSEYPALKYRSNYLAGYYLSHTPNTRPWWPAWSPDGQWIAVQMHGSIWRVDPASGAAVELTHNTKIHGSPAWSPDGKWILYTADDNWKSIQLEIVDSITGEIRKLTNDSEVYTDPTFAPDGQSVAYVTSAGSGFLNAAVRAIRNGDWAGMPVALTRDHRFGRPRLYFADNDFHTQPVWMPGGRELLLVSNRGTALGSGGLWRVTRGPDAMATGKQILAEQSLYRTRPDVSPDGTRVVYASTAGAADQYNHLYVLGIDGGHPYKLTFGDYDNFHPRWSPDGDRIAYITTEHELPELTVMDVHGGKKTTIHITSRKWRRPMGRVRVRVVDETGRAVPARISGEASDGKLYAPTDSYVFNARLAGGLRRLFYTRGAYEVEAPVGRMTIEASKGFEYYPERAEVDVKAGAAHDVTLRLRRHADMVSKGWVNGSTHVHMNYGGNFRNTPENMLLTAEAQGMHIVSALVANKDNRVLDWQYFRPGGKAHPASRPERNQLLVFGEENRPPYWGHTFYIGLREHLISPFLTGYEGTGLNSLFPTNSELFRKARAQGAATGYVHAFGGESDPLAGKGIGGAKGYAVDLALGLIDGLEWSSASRGSLFPLFHAWNNDFRVTPVGGEDTLANMQDNRPVGIIRTYTSLGGPVTVENWVNAIRRGRTFLSSGPLVEFTVNGKGPGEDVHLSASGTVTLKGEVWSTTPLRAVRIYRDGVVWKEVPARGAPHLVFQEEAQAGSSGWFALVVEADELPPAQPKAYAQAVTNAVRVYTGGGKIRSRESAQYFLTWISRLRAETADLKLWRSEKERAHAYRDMDAAAAVYQARIEEANR